MPYVYSTASCSTDHHVYKEGNNKDLARIDKTITIRGGANVATKHPNIWTPLGVVTKVSDEELAMLEKCTHFQNCIKHNFYKVEKKQVDVEKVVDQMTKKDRSAPKTPEDKEFLKGATFASNGLIPGEPQQLS